MPKKVRKQADGKVVAENISGRPLPKRGSLQDETGGKSAGTRNIRGPKNSPFNFVGRR
jgi:hypothetical protein